MSQIENPPTLRKLPPGTWWIRGKDDKFTTFVWFFFLIVSFFAAGRLTQVDWYSSVCFKDSVETTTGNITYYYAEAVRDDGETVPDITIGYNEAYRYKYYHPHTKTYYTGTSYRRITNAQFRPSHAIGEAMTVEYVSSRPWISRLTGMHPSDPIIAADIVPLIFLLLAGGYLLGEKLYLLYYIRPLLQRGSIFTGKIIDMQLKPVISDNTLFGGRQDQVLYTGYYSVKLKKSEYTYFVYTGEKEDIISEMPVITTFTSKRLIPLPKNDPRFLFDNDGNIIPLPRIFHRTFAS